MLASAPGFLPRTLIMKVRVAVIAAAIRLAMMSPGRPVMSSLR